VFWKWIFRVPAVVDAEIEQLAVSAPLHPYLAAVVTCAEKEA
jgi:hypothetical protein